MRILFISNNFPPEVNAPASRLSEHARHWIDEGHDVEVLTSAPHFPEGEVYSGYTNRFSIEQYDGIKITRIPMYITENVDVVRRTLSYLSFMISACWYFRRIQNRPDIVLATSPQFFTGIAGLFIARRKRVPFVLEVRDLWPESLIAVGAIKQKSIIRLLERLELYLYKSANHIIVVTNAFKRFIKGKGIDDSKISVLKNGAELSMWNAPLDDERLRQIRKEHHLDGKFVVSFIGTIGLAHRADILMDAAEKCTDPDVAFLIIGTGSKRSKIKARQAKSRLSNFQLLKKVPRDAVPYFLSVTDVSIVHLKASPLFKTVIPSKIFEAMATGTPIVLGVEGESKEIIDVSGAGISIEPENVEQLIQAISFLKSNPEVRQKMGQKGIEHVHNHYDRAKLARDYVRIMKNILE